MEIKRYHLANGGAQVVICRNRAYFAGITAREGAVTMAEQTADILAQYDALFAECGIEKKDLLNANTFLSDMKVGDDYGAVWGKWIGDEYPPAGVCVQSRLPEGKLISISMLAAVKQEEHHGY